MMAVSPRQSGMRLASLLDGMAELSAAQDLTITGLALDSRRVRPGDLFLACAGTHQHGLQFIPEAIRAGAAAVAWEPDGTVELKATVPSVAVPQLSQRLGVIADRFYAAPSRDLFVVGITGTDGKTSCSHFIAQALSSPQRPCGVIGTLGNGLYGAIQPGTHTTPDAVSLQAELARQRDLHATAVAMEVSSHGLDQGRVNGVRFDVAVLTNLSRDHLDYHGNDAAYAAAKARLFQSEGLHHAVLNLDDAFGRDVLRDLDKAVDVVAYGQGFRPVITRPLRWVWAEEVVLGDEGLSMTVDSSWGRGRLQARLLGGFNVSNLLATLAVSLLAGLDFDEALHRVSKVRTVPGRMECFGGGAKPLVVVDYAHTPRALEQALSALRPHCRGQLWCVFGAGGDRDTGKRPLMGAAAEALADYVVITDDNPRHEDGQLIVDGILAGLQRPEAAWVERDRAEAIRKTLRGAAPGDVVLVAGKGHESWQQVGDQRLAFSDREQVQARLAERDT